MNAERTNNRSKWLKIILPLFLTILVMVPRIANLNTFIGPDEKILWGWANTFAARISSGEWNRTLIGDGYPAVTWMWLNTIGVAIKWLGLHLSGSPVSFIEVIRPDRPDELYAERRLFLAFFNGLQILAAYPLLRRLWNRRIAVLAIIAMAVEPLSLAFARMIRTDAILSGFLLLSLLSSLYFLKTGRQRYNLLGGAMAGLAALSKLSGGVMAPVIIIIYAVYTFGQAKKGIKGSGRWFIKATLIWGAASAVIFFGLWPAWWFDPAGTFNLLWGSIFYYAVAVANERAGTYFWGSIYPNGAGPAFYGVLAALRLTPWLLLGTFAAIIAWLFRMLRRRSETPWYGLSALLFTVAYWTMISQISLKTERYFLPIIPALAILTAIETNRLLEQPFFKEASAKVLLTAAGSLLIFHPLLYHPLYSTYFDPLVTTPSFAQWALPFGNGEGVDEALKALSRKGTQYTVVCGTNYPRCTPFYKGEVWHQEDLRSSRWFEADYALWHIEDEKSGAFDQAELSYLRRQQSFYIAGYHGIDYTWLYPIPKPEYLTQGSRLEGLAVLLGYDAGGRLSSALSAGEELPLHLYWQNLGQGTAGRFWWRIVDQAGYVWSEAEAVPSIGFEETAKQEKAIVESDARLRLPGDMPPGRYTLKSGFALDSRDAGEFDLPSAGRRLIIEGWPISSTARMQKTQELMAPGLMLQGYDLPSHELTAGESFWVVFSWQAKEFIHQDYDLHLRLLNAAGKAAAEAEGQPLYGNFPTSEWPQGVNVRDPWTFNMPAEIEPGVYQMELTSTTAGSSQPIRRLILGDIRIVSRKQTFALPPMQQTANIRFGDFLTLLGYDASATIGSPKSRLAMKTYWRVEKIPGQEVDVEIRALDNNGRLLGMLRSPLSAVAPLTEWKVGEIITAVGEGDLDTDAPVSGNLQLRLFTANEEAIRTSENAEFHQIPSLKRNVVWIFPQK